VAVDVVSAPDGLQGGGELLFLFLCQTEGGVFRNENRDRCAVRKLRFTLINPTAPFTGECRSYVAEAERLLRLSSTSKRDSDPLERELFVEKSRTTAFGRWSLILTR
jgi:hypothetical protein